MSSRILPAVLAAGAIGFALVQKSPELEVPVTAHGPKVGERLPPFELPDQKGAVRNFESLRGPRGLVLVFFQSADW